METSINADSGISENLRRDLGVTLGLTSNHRAALQSKSSSRRRANGGASAAGDGELAKSAGQGA